MELLVAPYPMPTITLTGTGTTVQNLANDRLGRAFKIPGAGTQTIIVDLGSIKGIDTVALLAHDFDAGSQWRFWIGDTVASVTPASGLAGGTPNGPATYSDWIDMVASVEGLSRLHRQGLHHLTAPVSGRAIRVDVLTNRAGSIGRLVVGKAFKPAESRDYGWSQRVADLGSTGRSPQGLEDTTIRGKVLEFSWVWSGLTKDEAENQAIDLAAYAGVTRDVLFCADPTAANRHNLIAYGKMTEPAITTNYAEGWYDMAVQLQSKLILGL